MNANVPAIETFGLGKKYQGSNKFALSNLNITIMAGEVYGFLGPNGAGKSTTIRLLMNFIHPSEGHAHILGLNTVEDTVEIKTKIGYLPGDVATYSKMTSKQIFSYLSLLHRHTHNAYTKKLIKRFRLDDTVKVGSLSKGNKQKVGIIQAFMHEPEILILDEPTGGLDPLMQEEFFELIRETRSRGATVFLSSHNLTEVQKICDKVGFIRDGKLLTEQGIGEFAKSAVQTYDVVFAGKAPINDLRRYKKLNITINTPRHITVKVQGPIAPFLGVLSRYKVDSIERRESTLEDEFLRFYRGSKS